MGVSDSLAGPWVGGDDASITIGLREARFVTVILRVGLGKLLHGKSTHTEAIFRLKNGKLIRQLLGIPMGDALSPAMTIGTCGWMEREWMTSLHAATKTKFAAKRYMDDILLLMQKEGWDRQRFYEDFKRSECYARPLNLEEATDGTFWRRSSQCSTITSTSA